MSVEESTKRPNMRETQFMRTDESMDLRSETLHIMLWIERVTSEMLAELLGINRKSCKLLGNSSKAISLDHKVTFLCDLEAVPNDQRLWFDRYKEVRNQFAHNLDATSAEECLKLTNLTPKALLDKFPQPKEWSNEEQLRQALRDLGLYLVQVVEDNWEKVTKRRVDKFKSELNEVTTKAYFEASSRWLDITEQAIDKMEEPITKDQAKSALRGYAHFVREEVNKAIADYPDTFKDGLTDEY